MSKLIKNPLLFVPARYGFIGLFITFTLFLLLYFLGHNPLVVGRPLDFSFLIIPLMIFFGTKDFKVNYNQGELRFWQGMTCGFVTYLLLATGSALLIWLFLLVGDPTILDGYIDYLIGLMEQNMEGFVETLGEELYHEQMAKTRQTKAWVVALDDFWKKLSIGLFLTILIAIILRSSPKR